MRWNTHHLANMCPQRVRLPLHLPPVPPPSFPSKLIYRLRSRPCSCPWPLPAAVRPRLCVTGTATSPASLFHLSPTAYRTSQNHGISRLERDPEVSQSSPLLLLCFFSLFSHWPFATPWTAAHQAPPSSSISQSSFKLVSIESVILSKHLILFRPFSSCLQTSPAFRVFSNESTLHFRPLLLLPSNLPSIQGLFQRVRSSLPPPSPPAFKPPQRQGLFQ